MVTSASGSTDSLAVHLYGTHVADVTRGRALHRLRWTWTPRALARWGLGSRVVSHLLVMGEPVSDVAAGVFVAGLLPEGIARTHYAVTAGVDPDDLFALLARFGRDTPGALDFEPRPERRRIGQSPIRLGERDVRALLDDADSSHRGGEPTSISLPGLVPKIALSRAEDGTWELPPPGVPSTWIVKVAHPADSVAADVVDTEALCLDLGRRVGVTTIQGVVCDFDGRRAIAVSRYDRTLVDGRVQRIHQEDLAQAFGLNTADPARKFQRGRGLPSWRHAARALREDGGQLGTLARLVAFSFLVGNTDHHAKNTSILRLPDGGVATAPAYDIAVHLHHPGDHRTAFDLAGESDFATLSIHHVVEEIVSWGVPPERAQAAVLDVVTQVGQALQEVDRAAHAGVIPQVWNLLADRAAQARAALAPSDGQPSGSTSAEEPRPPSSDGPAIAQALEGVADPMTDSPLVVDFDDFFEEVMGHRPYVWQRLAAEEIRAGRVPERVVVPTGFGKTALMVAWLWALAEDIARVTAAPDDVRRVPLRYVVVVNRRIIVDDTAALARRLQACLMDPAGPAVAAVARVLATLSDEGEQSPLEVRELRGGMPAKPENIRHPAKAAIIVGTVDLIGSRLLFRGYGVPPQRRPIDAALLGIDSLLVLDEAHLAGQFAATLDLLDTFAARDEGRLGTLPARVTTTMTATPADRAAAFDWEREIARNPGLRRRRTRRGATRVSLVTGGKQTADASMLEHMERVEIRPGQTTIVFTNTAKQARECAARLAKRDAVKEGRASVLLLIGGMPPAVRDATIAKLAPMRTGTATPLGHEDPALIVVATSTLEVGADLDADRVVTPVASSSAVVQRLGRVNRVGAREGCGCDIVLAASTGDDVDPAPEPVYGQAASRLGRALRDREPRSLADLERLWASPDAVEWESEQPEPALMPRFVFDAYQRTAGSPNEAPVARWLRRPDDPRAEVMVAFRASLTQLRSDRALVDHLRRHPPQPEEIWTLPVSLVRESLGRLNRLAGLDPTRSGEPVVLSRAAEIREAVTPGAVLVLPPTASAFGLEWAGRDLVVDSAEPAFRLVPMHEAPDELPADQVWIPLTDEFGAGTGWIEVTPSRAPEEPVIDVAYPLDRHLADVERRARAWATRLRLPDHVTGDIALAALLHDEGKRAELSQREFSVTMSDDGTLRLTPGGTVLAKSALPRALWRRARRLVGVPDGYRHEADSAARLDEVLETHALQAHDAALVRHLVLTHHGLFRGAAPSIIGAPVGGYQDYRSARWASRPAEFEQLLVRYGPYSLALAETVLRLADWHESRLILERVQEEKP